MPPSQLSIGSSFLVPFFSCLKNRGNYVDTTLAGSDRKLFDVIYFDDAHYASPLELPALISSCPKISLSMSVRLLAPHSPRLPGSALSDAYYRLLTFSSVPLRST